MNRVGWLDTMRVAATVLVIFSHYAYIAGQSPSVQYFFEKYIFHIGGIGVIIFFAVSGYLAANSLEHSKSILEFYRRKIIRIAIPFAAAYLFMSLLLLLLGIFNLQIAERSPMSWLFHQGGSANAFLIGMTPICMDINLTHYFNIHSYLFVGEWFIGTILWLYLISPFLYKCLKKNWFIFSIIFLIMAYWISNTLKVENMAMFFGIRIPQFSFGMILFLLKDSISKNSSLILKFMTILGITFIGYGLIFSSHQNIISKIIFGAVPYGVIHYSLAAALTTYFVYILVKYLNENFSEITSRFNSFSNISYVAMLIHHVIIYRLNDIYHFTTLTKSGVFFFFLLVLLTTIFLSKQILKIYKPVEENLIKRRWYFG